MQTTYDPRIDGLTPRGPGLSPLRDVAKGQAMLVMARARRVL